MFSLIGNSEATSLLARGIELGHLNHAYILTGPRAVGKRTLAVQIAQALNCEADQSLRPCGACRICRQIGRNVHPDVRLIKRAPDRKYILLRAPSPSGPQKDYSDNIEFIQSDAQLRPADARFKVYIILNAEDLGEDAANRLLKTIEEPTQYVHFVLTATDRGALLPTIVSRCQELRLHPVPRAQIEQALVDRGLADPERAAALSGLAAGSPGWAIAAAADQSVVEVNQTDIRDLRDALEATRLDRLLLARGLAERWSSSPDSVRSTLRAWLIWWRDVLLVQVGLADRAASRGAALTAAESTARQLDPAATRQAQTRVHRAIEDLNTNVNPRLALDMLLLALPRT